MLSLNKNSMRLPIGGHQYPENGFTVKGDSFDEVVKLLTSFRLGNGKPLGNPKMDVLIYYAQNWPYLVRDDGQPEPAKSQDESYGRWITWVMGIWREPPTKILTTKEASYRWDKCKECPMNKPKDWASTEESAQMEQRLFLLRQGVDVPKYLGFCSCHGSDLSLFGFLEAPEKSSNKRQDEIQPSACFVL